jgi:hypothetical protein
MKKALLLFILLLTALSSPRAQEHYFRFTIEHHSELEEITRLVSVDKVLDGVVYAYANRKELNLFRGRTDYRLKMLPRPGLKSKGVLMADTIPEMTNWNRYPTYPLYVEIMQQFTEDHPEICRLDTLGTSTEGRLLLSLKISDQVGKEEAEPELFYTSTMHGDETAPFVLMLRLIDSLLTGYGRVANITRLIENMEIHINPLANPDGTYALGNESLNGATRYNANSVDLNRNFPDPTDGPHPDGNFYQAETKAMMEYAEENHFTLSANFHTGAEVVNYPWDTWRRFHVDSAWFHRLSHIYADAAIENSPGGYFTSISPDGVINGYQWYAVNGGRQDYMTYYRGGREVTIEVSGSKMTDSEQLPELWNYNKEALLLYMEECLCGIRGRVTDTAGKPVHARVELLEHDSENDNSYVFTDPEVGDYHRMVDSGKYDMVFSAYGMQDDTVRNVVVTHYDSVRVDVTLESSPVYKISGKITNARSGDPIENAEVVLRDTPLDTVYTDSLGYYRFPEVASGIYRLRILTDGYPVLFEEITVNTSSKRFDFSMEKGIIENFETGSLACFAWDTTAVKSWEVTEKEQYQGSFSAWSGNIKEDSVSVLTISLEVEEPGKISFFRKVYSEADYDVLSFFIDDELKGKWSGIRDWERYSYPVSEGRHAFTWIYNKDGDKSVGLDAAWVDYIEFPELKSPGLRFIPDTLRDTLAYGSRDTLQLQTENQGKSPVEYSLEVEDSALNTWITPSATEHILRAGGKRTHNYVVQTGIADSIYSTAIVVSRRNRRNDARIPVRITVEDPLNSPEPGLQGSVRCYPNPFSEVLYIDWSTNKPSDWLHIEFFDVGGQLIKSFRKYNIQSGLQHFAFRFDEYPAANGVILIRISSEKGVLRRKVIYNPSD